MAEFVSHRTTGAIATALLGGERASRCKSLMLVLSPDEPASVMAQFYVSEEEGQALAAALETGTWQLVDVEPPTI